MTKKISVLVIDDAAFMVKAVSELLSSDPDIEVIGSARNGREGLEKIKVLHPDVVTLDIDMPIMDGITTIRHIMIEAPVPIVVLSSLFSDGAITFEALRLGVVDFLPKPSGAISRDIHQAKQQIIDRVKIASVVNIQNIRRVKLTAWDDRDRLTERYHFQSLEYILLVGTTLGGPNTSVRLFSRLPPNLPLTAIVVQEISPKIISAFAKKFDEHVPWKIEVARDGIVLEQGTCYISPYEKIVTVDMNSKREACLKVSDSLITANGLAHDPNTLPLNQLFTSATHVFEQHTIGILLTGVGMDGTQGFINIKHRSGVTIAQKLETCVYPNLTRSAIEHGTVDQIVDENELVGAVISAMNRQFT